MSQITATEVKRHVQALDFEVDDDLLAGLQASAEDWVQRYVRRDLNAEFPGGWPKACCHAVLTLVAVWYRDREAGVPQGVLDLLAQHRDLS